MGRRKGWFSAVKKALGSEHGDKKFQKSKKMESGESEVEDWSATEEEPDMIVSRIVDDEVLDVPWNILEEPYVFPYVQEGKNVSEVGRGEKRHGYNVAAEAVINLTNWKQFAGKSKEEVAAVRIQAAFRRHLAKRELTTLRGLKRLKALMQGASAERQTAVALQCMQTLTRVQSQIRARRMRMSEENQALQRQLQQKHEKEIEKMKLTIGDDWNDSTKSKEKLEASLQFRQEAAMRRERALAYAHSQQQKWRNGSRAENSGLMDPINPHWGWSWLERWMDTRPWESSTAANHGGIIGPLSVDEISKAYYAHRASYPDSTKPLPFPQRPSHIATRQSTSAPSIATKLKSSSTTRSGSGNGRDKDLRSIPSLPKQRRHSVASSSMSHNARLSSTHSMPPRSYVTSSEAQAARARLKKSSSCSEKSNRTLEIGSPGSSSVKKRLSYSPSSAPSAARRLSYSPSSTPSAARSHPGPLNVDLSSTKDTSLKT